MIVAFNSRIFWFLFAVVAVLTSIRVSIAPESFADFASYVELVGQLKAQNSLEGFILEPASKIFLYAAATFVDDHAAVTILSYFNTAFFIAIFCKLVLRKERNLAGLVVLVGLYVPLMAFVALRAMPAYLIVALAVEKIWERETKTAFALCLLASLFHFSALLIIFPLFMAGRYNQRKTIEISAAQTRIVGGLKIFFISAIISFVAPRFFGTLLAGIIPADSLLSRYSAYLSTENESSLSHAVYFYFVSMIVAAFLFQARKAEERVFASLSILIFALLSVSPVAAYRYSLYFIIPILLNFRANPNGSTYTYVYASFFMFLISLGFFFTGMWQALQVD